MAVQFKADIASKRAAGKIVALSPGGAEGNITLNTDADEDGFPMSKEIGAFLHGS